MMIIGEGLLGLTLTATVSLSQFLSFSLSLSSPFFLIAL